MAESDDNALVRRALEMERVRRSGSNVSLPCPLPACGGKRKPNLSVHDSGPWKCWRCGATGFLPERGDPHRRHRDRSAARADDRARIDRARQIFEICRVIQPGDPVDRYLRSRGLTPVGSDWWPVDLKISRSAHPSELDKGAKWSRYHCMVAAVRNLEGVLMAIHRTWITDEGTKAPVDPVKMALGPTAGCAVRLGDGHEKLVVGEGIETTFAAWRKLDDPIVSGWAALHAEGMSKLPLPTDLRELWIAVDMDSKGKNPNDVFGTIDRRGRLNFGSPGIEAGFRLATRARAQGVEVHTLVPAGKDHCA